jgi:hypothetical protein
MTRGGGLLESVIGHKRTFSEIWAMSAIPPKAVVPAAFSAAHNFSAPTRVSSSTRTCDALRASGSNSEVLAYDSSRLSLHYVA